MIKRKYLIVLLFLLLSLTFLVACAEKKPTINVYNWGDYMDKSIFKDFEDEYGIRIKYAEFATNEDLYVKIKQGGSHYDLIFPSDYMIERMIREDLLEKLDKDQIPNWENVGEGFLDLDFDPENEYSVPYFWGTLGIIYNPTMIDEELDSWADLWNEKYREEIIMLKSQRDTIAVALKKLGYSLNSRDISQLEEAKAELIRQKPLVYAYLGDEVKDLMVAEDAAIAVVWSGDAVEMIRQNPDLTYVIPKEGSNLWFDSMVIPKTAQNKEGAQLFINYLCRSDIAASNADYVGYSTPIPSAVDLLSDDLKNDQVAYPSLDLSKQLEIFQDPYDIIREYDRIWTDLIGE